MYVYVYLYVCVRVCLWEGERDNFCLGLFYLILNYFNPDINKGGERGEKGGISCNPNTWQPRITATILQVASNTQIPLLFHMLQFHFLICIPMPTFYVYFNLAFSIVTPNIQ